MVEKGNDKYYYSLNNLTEEIPAQLGSGAYIVKILQNTSGNKYKVVSKSTLDVMNNSLDVYLSSSQPVYWEGKDKLVELANTIITDNSSNEEITKAVYDYIIKNIKYDHYKINNIGTDYVPDITSFSLFVFFLISISLLLVLFFVITLFSSKVPHESHSGHFPIYPALS